MAKVRTTQMGLMHRLLCQNFLDLLQNGAILEDAAGNPVLDKVTGEPLRRKPTAAEFGQIRQFLKDNGIDEEAAEGSAIADVSKSMKALPKYEDDEPLFIPERDGQDSV
jgi:hypothetical protein